ncbi:hypothetical protein CVT26_009932 [Gymnopilus dilepis]|uniref:Seipin n=1 Tax=Gymnopilus dilepis TaxID=231916 RepID=A0A409VL98_9AGAR|nr:hypothetical protein CVT26_009932 [Gymnopilus dilepis]
MLPRISSTGLVSAVLAAVRPLAPRLVPLFVCSFFIPVIVFLSAAAGWIVWSNLSVSWQVPLYLQYGDGVPPYAFVNLPPLSSHQRYDISVDLALPYTESNIALGNFMTSLTLHTPANKTVVHVRRPAIALPPTSRLFFSTRTTSHINVVLLESFVPGKSGLSAHVRIGREDSWKTLGSGQGREVSVTSAYLRGLVVPHGVRGLAIRFPLLSATISGGIFFLILSLILVTCVFPLLLSSSREDATEGELAIESKKSSSSISAAPPSPSAEKESRRRRRSRGSRERLVKSEVEEESIPVKEEETTRGLRRRSSKQVFDDDEEK